MADQTMEVLFLLCSSLCGEGLHVITKHFFLVIRVAVFTLRKRRLGSSQTLAFKVPSWAFKVKKLSLIP